MLAAAARALGRAFFFAGFLPSLVFLLVNLWLIRPHLPPQALRATLASLPYLENLEWIVYLLIPTGLGALLMALNAVIIKLYEGEYRWQRGFLLRPLLERNRREHRAAYAALEEAEGEQEEQDGKLTTLKEEYNRIMARIRSGQGDQEELEFMRQSVWVAIDEVYYKLYAPYTGPAWRLPVGEWRARPTDLGNAWAIIEEYPDYRYGMEGVTWWPRLISQIPDNYAAQIASEKTTVDFLLNSSLLGGVLALESFFVIVAWEWSPTLLVLGLAALLGWWLFYRAAVGSTRVLGNLIASCYDLFRDDLLAEFGLEKPSQLAQERVLWADLGKYLTSGDPIFYPDMPEEYVEMPDEITSLRRCLSQYRRNLYRLEEMRAQYGANVPLDILNGIDDMQERIVAIEGRLDELSGQVPDTP